MDIGPRPGINISKNQVRTFAVLGGTAAQRRRPIHRLTGIPWKRLSGVRFAYRGMTSTFDLSGVSDEGLAGLAIRQQNVRSAANFVRQISDI